MDFATLLSPNITYLVLVIGIILAMLALLSPGTGALELGALFLFLLAGYGIYNTPVNLWALMVLLAGVTVFVILALRKSRRWWHLAIAIAALVIGSAYLFSSNVWYVPAVHPLLALVTSLLASGLMWIIARRGLEAISRRPDNKLQDVVGAVGETRSEVFQEGSVYVSGELWSAHSKKPIPSETRVRVVSRDGFTLEIEPVDQA
jgi:membrane-bound serine protease (ClpP class)